MTVSSSEGHVGSGQELLAMLDLVQIVGAENVLIAENVLANF